MLSAPRLENFAIESVPDEIKTNCCSANGWFWTWCRSKEKTPRIWILILVLALCTIIAICVFFLISTSSQSFPVTSELSTKIVSRMNISADPCDDFYEFACGNFLKETVIPDDELEISSFSITQNKLTKQLREVLLDSIKPKEIEPFKNVKRFYRACMNTDLIEARGIIPLKSVLTAMGGCPMFDGELWDEDSWTWQNAIKESAANGFPVNYFFEFGVTVDPENTSKRIIIIQPTDFETKIHFDSVKNSPELKTEELRYMVEQVVHLGVEESKAKKDMTEVSEFIGELRKISATTQSPPRSLTLNQLGTLFYHDWLTFFNSILPAESQLTPGEFIIVGNQQFFQGLGRLLKKTPKKTLANFVTWGQVSDSIELLPRDFEDRRFEFVRTELGMTKLKPRSQKCISEASKIYTFALSGLYIRKYFHEDVRAKVLEMVVNIKNEFKVLLQENSWMDEDTKEEAMQSIESLHEVVGYPENLLNDDRIVEFYDKLNVTVDENKYLESSLAILAALNKDTYRELRTPVDRKAWSELVNPTGVDAAYVPSKHAIYLSAGILQDFFFDAERPQYMNFGAIGQLIGHEITHAIRGQQRGFDPRSKNLEQSEAQNTHNENVQCLVRQYGNFTEPSTHDRVDGTRTLEENIADIRGVKAAYRAYNRWARTNFENQLPVLDFTPKQMFWTATGQMLCKKYRKEEIKNHLKNDPHAPYRFRVLGMMMNSKDFADDFKCSSVDRMSSQPRCDVW